MSIFLMESLYMIEYIHILKKLLYICKNISQNIFNKKKHPLDLHIKFCFQITDRQNSM